MEDQIRDLIINNPSKLLDALKLAIPFYEAQAEARRLCAELGQEHPRTLQAIIRVIELDDPTFMDRTMAECGIHLPEPTHCDGEGAPLFSAAQIAEAVGKPVQEVEQDIAEQVSAGTINLHSGASFPRQ